MSIVTESKATRLSANPEIPSLGNLSALLEAQAAAKQRIAELLRELAVTDKTIRVGANITLFGESFSEAGLYHLTEHPTLGFKKGKRGRLEDFLTGDRHFSATSVEFGAGVAASGSANRDVWDDEHGGIHQRIDGVWRLVAEVRTGDWPHTTYRVFELVR